MMRLLFVVPLLTLGSAELLTVEYRAITMSKDEHRTFRVVGLETVTGSTGRCLQEGMDTEEPETFFIHAECAAVRTSLVWLKGGKRLHVMACAEEDPPKEALALRKKLSAELKNEKSVTACVHDGRVQLVGWAAKPELKARMQALEKRYGYEKVKDAVELLEE